MITDKQTKLRKRPTRLDPYLLGLLKDPRFLKIVDEILTRPCCSSKPISEIHKLIAYKTEPTQFSDNAFQLLEDFSEMDGHTEEGLKEMILRITSDYLSYATVYLLSGILIGIMYASRKDQPPVSKTSAETA